MNPTRGQMLTEMGITPFWRLRDQKADGLLQQDDEQAIQPEPPVSADLPKPLVKAAVCADVAGLDWEQLEKCMAACHACELAGHRRQVVPGVGDPQAQWLFVSEGPGAEEDAKGEPFVGQAGKLLDNLLAAIGLRRDEKVYIANAVKCRPPGNRTPEANEIAACNPYLLRQIELIEPRLIVLLGRSAVHAVLHEEKGTLASLRGKRFEYKGIPVVVTYHPAYLLRNLPEKAKVWEDLLFARRVMEGEKTPSLF